MTKLDDIENRNKNFFSLTCRSFVDDMDYMIKLARKAEEMANFYAAQNIIDINYINDRGSLVNYWKKNGDKAREFLSFLEKGDE